MIYYYMNIILTGCTGYVGQHLLYTWIKDGLLFEQHHEQRSNNDNVHDNDIHYVITIDALCRGTISNTNDNDDNEKMKRKEELMKQFQTNIHDLIIQQQQKETTSTLSSKQAITSWSCDVVNVIYVDITNHESIMKWIDNKKSNDPNNDHNNNNSIFNICIHTAACSNPRICQENNKFAYETNVPTLFFKCMYDYYNKSNIHIIALSTDHVYDGINSQSIYSDDDENNNDTDNKNEVLENYSSNNTTNTESSSSIPKPCNVYGQTKLQMEHELRSLYNTANKNPSQSCCNIIILRSSIILGPIVSIEPLLSHDTFIHFCYKQLHNQQSTTYYTNEIRNVISIYDVIYTIQYHIMQCMNKVNKNNEALYQIYNMGGLKAVSRYDIAKAITNYYYYNEYNKEQKQSTKTSTTTTTDNNNNLLLLYTNFLMPCEKTIEESYQLGPCPVPLNISMDSTKLYHTINQYNNNNNQYTFRSLDQIIIDTFSSQK